VKAKRDLKAKKTADGVLKALRRAAKKAVELARLTGTPAYVLENGRMIDIAKQTKKKQKKHGRAAGKKGYAAWAT
jgi:hypothetical protein